MARKLKEIDIEPVKNNNKKRKEPIIEPEIIVNVTEVPFEKKSKKQEKEKEKKPPTEAQLAARERARIAREEKKNEDIEAIKKAAVEEALKQKEIEDKKIAKAAERKRKKDEKEKSEIVVLKPEIQTEVLELKDEPKVDKPSFSTPILKNDQVVKPNNDDVVKPRQIPPIFAERPSDFSRGVKRGTPFNSSNFTRRIM